MWADDAALDAASRRLDEWESSLVERADRARALAARVRALTGTAHNPDRTVTVTVDSAGQLVDLRLDERIRQQPGSRTAEQILTVSRAARADLLRQITAITTETLGDDDPSTRAIIDSYRDRLGRDQGPSDAGR
ncbi:YbaB/EbfC family nucleoid-associated protein [Micromonospora sp. WMMD1120]|uniref:YbaB/EbfC family nucleoid-associated protein n=1 Tax=Micromonospora sp. WMMD1120 TaxID=3016106 RepID=UPI0024175429|nr:YbaB/EbfC family nucleoid-associated protein [Micromonospora sp. WMMD1120]MDG4810583.1 YbaB/EbfC family nucleoid-associated protein [Micromonospora sp. WMMD1120]